jgi:D-alanyl-D-alanine carboxypeptidase
MRFIHILKQPWPYVAVLAIILVFITIHNRSDSRATTDAAQASDTKDSQKTATPPAQPSFDKKQYSVDDPASPWVVVNKQRPLSPKDFAPEVVVPNVPLRSGNTSAEMQVAKISAPALEEMVNAAKQEGINLMLGSGYRPYSMQVSVYNAEVKNYGQTQADRESARPGFSEHQTGLAADLEPTSRQCEIEDCFGDLPEGKWVAANAWKYGFILRYTPDKEQVTGYRHEAWHVRYVGKELAKELHDTKVETLEEFFGLPAAPNY